MPRVRRYSLRRGWEPGDRGDGAVGFERRLARKRRHHHHRNCLQFKVLDQAVQRDDGAILDVIVVAAPHHDPQRCRGAGVPERGIRNVLVHAPAPSLSTVASPIVPALAAIIGRPPAMSTRRSNHRASLCPCAQFGNRHDRFLQPMRVFRGRSHAGRRRKNGIGSQTGCRGAVSRRCARGLFAVLLNAGGAEPRQAVAVDRTLPGEELLHGQRVAGAGLFQPQQAAADRGDDFGLAADDPTRFPGAGRSATVKGVPSGPMT